MSGGKSVAIKVSAPAPLPLDGQWNVSFPIRGEVTHKKLQTGFWTDSTEDEVKYFSGTAIYVRDFQWSGAKDSGPRWVTDLGNVAFLVNNQLNGKRPRYTL
jgi:hypothetical protein